jgi:hypothetical protein
LNSANIIWPTAASGTFSGVDGLPEPRAEGLSMIQTPLSVLSVVLPVLAGLFVLQRHPRTSGLFRVVPLLVFCYFVPALLSNVGIIPAESEVYVFIRRVLLPASLVLLVLSTDIPAVLSLGRDAVVLFLAGSVSIAVSGPRAFLTLGWMFPPEALDQAWRGRESTRCAPASSGIRLKSRAPRTWWTCSRSWR